MGRWTLTALVINSIIGSGIFGLPSVVAGYVGRQSPLAYLVAAAGIGFIIACFAEVASQFGSAGGPYLYAREAFGRFIGIEIAWLLLLVRLTAAAAAANLFTNYLAEFWPGVQEPVTRLSMLAVLIGFIAALNIRGVKSGAAASNIFTVAKLAPLILFVIAGAVFLSRAHPTIPGELRSSASVPVRNWLEAVLVLMFAYGGFEGAVIPMAEAKDPRRDRAVRSFRGARNGDPPVLRNSIRCRRRASRRGCHGSPAGRRRAAICGNNRRSADFRGGAHLRMRLFDRADAAHTAPGLCARREWRLSPVLRADSCQVSDAAHFDTRLRRDRLVPGRCGKFQMECDPLFGWKAFDLRIHVRRPSRPATQVFRARAPIDSRRVI